MSSGDQQESFMTVAEVAEVLKLNPQTVRNWIDQGSLPAVRVGRRVRIKRSDFERVVEESYSGAPAMAARSGPSAEDFWGGTPVGLAEPAPAAATAVAEGAPPESDGEEDDKMGEAEDDARVEAQDDTLVESHLFDDRR